MTGYEDLNLLSIFNDIQDTKIIIVHPVFNNYIEKVEGLKEVYKPEFYRFTNENDVNTLKRLLQDTPGIFVHDEIHGQLKELIKSKNPTKKLSAEEYDVYIQNHIGDTPIEEYGVWVYYPWASRLIHILDEEEFIYLRTAANRHKITEAEMKILAEKKVGVIGLSVGQSVSVTIAMERGCGELRLADFDRLELNNLNRIRTGVQNLGLLKVVSVAREIAEIDPYFKVVIYPEGITEHTIDDFYTKGGKLDVVIDECDGVDVKILCRIKAKELQIPVLMEASDRGTMDVERFDLEPERPIIHGWLEHLKLDFEVLKNLKTSEQKLPYILPISGMDTLSPRMKASMVEIEQTLTTWPQLATAVTLGGALTADTCRRMFLNQFTQSGRYFVDLEEIVPEKNKKDDTLKFEPEPPLVEEEINKEIGKTQSIEKEIQYELSEGELNKILEAAGRAPSAGNNQPWQWFYKSGVLYLFHEKARTKSFGDYKDIASRVALGAAIENLELCCHSMDIASKVRYFPNGTDSKLIAAITFEKSRNSSGLYKPDVLADVIYTRETNRGLSKRVPIPDDKYAVIKEAVESVNGAEFHYRSGDKDLDKLADIMGAAEKLRLLHEEGHFEFYEKEIRWDDKHSRETKDGIDIGTVDVTPSEVVGLKLVRDPRVVKLLAEWGGGKALENMARKAIAGASAVGLITMPSFSPENFVIGGRAVERMWLTANKNKISVQPMLAVPLHFARLVHGNSEGMPDFMKTEFGALRAQFLSIFPGVENKGEIFLFRLCIADEPEIKSYRYPVNEVLTVL